MLGMLILLLMRKNLLTFSKSHLSQLNRVQLYMIQTPGCQKGMDLSI